MFNVESLERAELGESLLTWVSGRGPGAQRRLPRVLCGAGGLRGGCPCFPAASLARPPGCFPRGFGLLSAAVWASLPAGVPRGCASRVRARAWWFRRRLDRAERLRDHFGWRSAGWQCQAALPSKRACQRVLVGVVLLGIAMDELHFCLALSEGGRGVVYVARSPLHLHAQQPCEVD